MTDHEIRKSEYKSRSFVRIDGVYHSVEELDLELRTTIFIELNERALRAAGYVPITENEAVTMKAGTT